MAAIQFIVRSSGHGLVLWASRPFAAFARKLHDIIHEEYPGDQCFTAGDFEIGNGRKFVDVAWSRETVEGEGRIIGAASIGANPVQAEAGIATVLVKSTTKAGTITVKASSFGLAERTATIVSKKVDARTR